MKPLIPWFEVPVLNIPLGSMTLPLHGFGLLVALGFLVGGQIAMNRARRMGDSADALNRLIGWLVVGTFVGGHVGNSLMYEPMEHFRDPIRFLYVWEGLSSYGGFAVCVPLSVYFFYRYKLNLWSNLDHLAHGLAIGWFLGRMGCFVAHDHPGSPTNFYLGVYGICPGLGKGVACHDTGLYEALWSLGMFVIFLIMDRWPQKPGVYVALFWAAYGPVRFFLDFLRPESTDVRYFGLTPAHYFSVATTLVAVGLLVQRLRSKDEPYWKDPGALVTKA